MAASADKFGRELGGGMEGRMSPPGRASFDGAGSLDILSRQQLNKGHQIEKPNGLTTYT